MKKVKCCPAILRGAASVQSAFSALLAATECHCVTPALCHQLQLRTCLRNTRTGLVVAVLLKVIDKQLCQFLGRFLPL